MNGEAKPLSSWDIIAAMCDLDGNAVTLSPLGNVRNATAGRRGTDVTIGCEGNIVKALMLDCRYIGGLLLVDKEAFAARKKVMEAERQPRPLTLTPDAEVPARLAGLKGAKA